MAVQELPLDVQSLIRSSISVPSVVQTVTELVLNSLDAGATDISVSVNFKYFKIRVEDNGCGMSRDEIEVIGERYMTSKCHSIEDLRGKLGFFGFRGEALASIRDVAGIVSIVSKQTGDEVTNSKMFLRGSPLKENLSKSIASKSGTIVTIHDLLYNLPVRQKTVQETLDIEDIKHQLECIALMHPQVSFRLQDEQKRCIIFEKHQSADLRSCFSHIFGLPIAQHLAAIEHVSNNLNITGYIGKEATKYKNLQFVFVNKRIVLNTKIHQLVNNILAKSSILRANGPWRYKPIPKEMTSRNLLSMPNIKRRNRFGVYVLNIICPYADYDICFDPKKTVIEFRDWRYVLTCIEDCMRKFLERENLVEESTESSSPITLLEDIEKEVADDQSQEMSDDEEPFTLHVARARHGIPARKQNVIGAAISQHENKDISVSSTDRDNFVDLIVGSQNLEGNVSQNPEKDISNYTCLLNTSRNCDNDLMDVETSAINEKQTVEDNTKCDTEVELPCKDPKTNFDHRKKPDPKFTKNNMNQFSPNNSEDGFNMSNSLQQTFHGVKEPFDLHSVASGDSILNGSPYFSSERCISEEKFTRNSDEQSSLRQNSSSVTNQMIYPGNSEKFMANCNHIHPLNMDNKTPDLLSLTHHINNDRKCKRNYMTTEEFIQTNEDTSEQTVNKHCVISEGIYFATGINKKQVSCLEDNCCSTMKSFHSELSSCTVENENSNSQYFSDAEESVTACIRTHSRGRNYHSVSEAQSNKNRGFCTKSLVEQLGSEKLDHLSENVESTVLHTCMDTFENIGTNHKLQPIDTDSDSYIDSGQETNEIFVKSDNLCGRYDSMEEDNISSPYFKSNPGFCEEEDNFESTSRTLINNDIVESKSLSPEESIHYNSKSDLRARENLKRVNQDQKEAPYKKHMVIEIRRDCNYYKTENGEAQEKLCQETMKANIQDILKMEDVAEKHLEGVGRNSATDEDVSVCSSNTIGKHPILIEKEGLMKNHKCNTNDCIVDCNEENSSTKSSHWLQLLDFSGKTFYVHKDSGMTTYDLPAKHDESSKYTVEERYGFLPKGMSPIVQNEVKRCKNSLTPGTHNDLLEAILYDADSTGGPSELKWKSVVGSDNKDSKKLVRKLLCDAESRVKHFRKAEEPTYKKKLEKLSEKVSQIMYPTEYSKCLFSNMHVVGQCDKKFIIVYCSTKLDKIPHIIGVFDQHAVHERIRLEMLMKDYTEENEVHTFKSIELESPIDLSLNKKDFRILKDFKNEFGRLGVTYKIISDSCVRVQKVPTCLYNREMRENSRKSSSLERFIRCLITDHTEILLETHGNSFGIPAVLQEIINYEACRGAIKFGDELMLEECISLIRGLEKCDQPFLCAHGRPTFGVIYDMERMDKTVKMSANKLHFNM